MNSKNHQIELTRHDDVNDINPQCFSRGNDYRESLGPNVTNVTSQISIEKHKETMRQKTACKACRETIHGARYITDQNDAFCSQCIDSDGLHQQFWPDCSAAWHQPLDHMTDIRFKGASAL